MARMNPSIAPGVISISTCTRRVFTEVPQRQNGACKATFMSEKVTAQLGDKQIHIQSGKLAKQADGAVTVQLGETIVLVAAVAATKAKPGQEFFPLTVDYREKAAAAGKFPGGYFKREGRPTEKEILTCRLTDRPIRPLFPKGWYNAVQVQTVVLSAADGENDPDILSIISASAALSVSDIPWDGPLGAVHGWAGSRANSSRTRRMRRCWKATWI